MAARHPDNPSSIAVITGQPLIGLVLIEDGQEVERYFTNDVDADTAVTQETSMYPGSPAGIWNDLDWDETVSALELIRHESVPTPPFDEQ